MPDFATFASLRKLGEDAAAKGMLKEAVQTADKTTFLSHSTADDDLVAGAVVLLQNHGGRVYVDHRDSTVPTKNPVEIANHLRAAITSCRKFVMLASPRSKESKWMPWELGLGDGVRSGKNVAILPSAESATDQTWAEREYLGLYGRIVFGPLQGFEKPLWMVWDHRSNTAERLTSWLTV